MTRPEPFPLKLSRPQPPAELDPQGEFRPAPDVRDWLFNAFIDAGAALENPDHAHLRGAHIGVLWTNVPNGRHMRVIVGQCELGKPMAQGRWAKARAEQQYRQWFGAEPDFVLTFFTEYAEHATDAQWCALVEHELYHAAQELDEFGAPKFSRSTGRPVYAIKGHDVEEHVGVVRRYGVTSEALRQMLEAAQAGPSVASARIAHVCGTCQARKAA